MIRHYKHKRNRGFTLVELMIAMAFVSMLLLAIAFVVLRISGIYNKGVTIKAVNQAGRTIVEDMKRTIAESDPATIDTTLQQSGRLCTGTYSYVWNLGDSGTAGVNKYRNDGPAVSNKRIRLVKVRDNGGQYCNTQGGLPDIVAADATELLTSSDISSNNFIDTNLTIQQFDISPLTTNLSSGSALYKVTMLLSNADQDVIDSMGNCKPPKDSPGNSDYCAVNEFNFTVRPGSKGGQ